MKLFEKKCPSNHIRIDSGVADPHEKGDLAVFGSLSGIWDYDVDSTDPAMRIYSINVGYPISVFNAQQSDITGGPAAPSDIIYITSTGTLTKTAASNEIFGTCVGVFGASCDIAANG